MRTPVFIEEQNVAPDFEWDELDASAVHLLAILNNEPIGCLRIIDFHKIGRMAVLKEYRGNGAGNRSVAGGSRIFANRKVVKVYIYLRKRMRLGFIKRRVLK